MNNNITSTFNNMNIGYNEINNKSNGWHAYDHTHTDTATDPGTMMTTTTTIATILATTNATG